MGPGDPACYWLAWSADSSNRSRSPEMLRLCFPRFLWAGILGGVNELHFSFSIIMNTALYIIHRNYISNTHFHRICSTKPNPKWMLPRASYGHGTRKRERVCFLRYFRATGEKLLTPKGVWIRIDYALSDPAGTSDFDAQMSSIKN
jgi:hypothetical protein